MGYRDIYTFDEKKKYLTDHSTDMRQVEMLIYQWVKDGVISPEEMGKLLIDFYKKLVY